MRTLKRDLLAALVAIAVVLSVSPPAILAAPSLKRLQGIDEMRSWFNGAKGHPRVILLLSPT